MPLEYLTVEHLNTKDLIRIFSKIEINSDLSWSGSPCWHWFGARATKGYGHIRLASVNTIRIHRILFAWLIHPIPTGQKYGELDHLCRRPSCCNPLHMEFTSHCANVLRGDSPQANNARKTHCNKGHILDKANTYIIPSTGSRVCRICQAKYQECLRKTETNRTYKHNWYIANRARLKTNDDYR